MIERAPPLARTLDLRDGMRVWFHAMPEEIFEEIAEYALELMLVGDPALGVDGAHVFVAAADDLAALLASLRYQVSPEGQVWVSWQDGGAVDAEMVRKVALPLGYFDTKVCAVGPDWHGLKLVIRKDLR